MDIAFEEFKKLRIRIGLIVGAERVEGTDKLLKLRIDFGNRRGRESRISETSEKSSGRKYDKIKL